MTDRLTSCATREYRVARSGAIGAQQPAAHLRPLQEQEQHQDEDGEQLQQQRERALAQAQRGLGQALAEGDQLGRVLVHPGLDVVPAHQIAEPAAAMLRVGHVGRQLLGQVADPVGQRITERDGQADEDNEPPQRDDGHRPAAPLDLPALQRHHGRVQDHRDEGRHDDQEDDVLEPVDDLPEQVDHDHHEDRGQDGRQGDTPGPGGGPQAVAPGPGWWRVVAHLAHHCSPLCPIVITSARPAISGARRP